jgi:triacylglycerol lipase
MMNIVLCHGILGFGRISVPGAVIDYFNSVREFLETTFADIPLTVLVTQVSPVSGIHIRGQELATQILEALKDGSLVSDNKTHIIAHSMGGLDARFALSPANPNNIASQITSLTTISTPHGGSPVADLLCSGLDGQAPTLFLRTMEKRIGSVIEEIGVPLAGLKDLTTDTTTKFNENCPDDKNVKYFSIAGRGRDDVLKTNKLFIPSHLLIEIMTGEANDGLVTLSSALHGDAKMVLWPADHADEVGHDLDGGPSARPPNFEYLARYAEIVQNLKAL